MYIGAAMNLLYGLTDNLIYDTATCTYSIYQEVVVDQNGFQTFYVYSQHHLENDLIPSNELIGDTASADRWRDFIDLNNSAKDNAAQLENRSWDAGIGYSSSTTQSQSETFSIDFQVDLSASLEGQTGVEANGVGVTYGQFMDLTMSFGGSVSQAVSSSRTTGYSFADDDIGDNFTVNIKTDPLFGTPVFELVSGESQCPHEEGTQPREGVQILVDNNTESIALNVSTDQAALFSLFVGNTSQSGETGTYAVDIEGDYFYGAGWFFLGGH